MSEAFDHDKQLRDAIVSALEAVNSLTGSLLHGGTRTDVQNHLTQCRLLLEGKTPTGRTPPEHVLPFHDVLSTKRKVHMPPAHGAPYNPPVGGSAAFIREEMHSVRGMRDMKGSDAIPRFPLPVQRQQLVGRDVFHDATGFLLCEIEAPVERTVGYLHLAMNGYHPLVQAVNAVHKAKGRYNTQVAMCRLYDLVGLPNVKPEKE